jgi:hypothetical protein
MGRSINYGSAINIWVIDNSVLKENGSWIDRRLPINLRLWIVKGRPISLCVVGTFKGRYIKLWVVDKFMVVDNFMFVHWLQKSQAIL